MPSFSFTSLIYYNLTIQKFRKSWSSPPDFQRTSPLRPSWLRHRSPSLSQCLSVHDLPYYLQVRLVLTKPRAECMAKIMAANEQVCSALSYGWWSANCGCSHSGSGKWNRYSRQYSPSVSRNIVNSGSQCRYFTISPVKQYALFFTHPPSLGVLGYNYRQQPDWKANGLRYVCRPEHSLLWLDISSVKIGSISQSMLSDLSTDYRKIDVFTIEKCWKL